MTKSQGGSLKKSSNCLACGETGHYVQCKDKNSDNSNKKVVLKETVGLITNEDPSLTNMRRRGWYLASRCTVHVCNSRDMFVNYLPLSNHEVILEENNNHVEVAGIGTVVLRFTTGKVLTLLNVFHMPTIIKCLISVSKLTKVGCFVSFSAEECTIVKSQEIMAKGYHEDGLYRLSVVENHPGENRKSDIPAVKVLLNETISLITNEDPRLTNRRRRGWYMATRCTVHVCNSRDMFVNYQPLSNHEVILEGNNSHVEVAGVGSVVLRLTTGKVLTLSDVFHIPEIIKCLISVRKLTMTGCSVLFTSKDCTINKSEEIIGKGYREDDLYRLGIMEDRPGENIKSDTPTVKVVLNETMSLITNEDPGLTSIRRRGWYLATRCTAHVCNSRDMFVNYQSLSNHKVILEDINSHVEVAGIGSVVLRFTSGKVLTLSNVFYIPKIVKCLVSVVQLSDLDFEMIFHSKGCSIVKSREIVGKGYKEDGMFRLSIIEVERPKVVLRETIGLITVNEDPVLTNMRRRGWYLASRCSVHVSNSRDMFVNYLPLSCHEVIMDNDSRVEVVGIGTVVLRFTTGKVLTLTNVFHIPTIRKCLVSIGKLDESGFSISFGKEIVIQKSHVVVGKGYSEDGLFRLSLVEEVTGGI